MDITTFKRDPDYIKGLVKTVGNVVVAESPLRVHIPKYYLNGKLGSMENTVKTIAILGLVAEKGNTTVYGTIMLCAKVSLVPDSMTSVVINETEYMELQFNKGSTVLESTDIVRNGPLIYNFYDEIVAKGKTPWYVSYTDLARLFDTAPEHAGVDLGADHAIYEMLAATRARNPKDRVKYYRNMLKSKSDLSTSQPDIIPLRSVAFGATNTTARLLGAYIGEGMTSALINQTDNLERVEELLLS